MKKLLVLAVFAATAGQLQAVGVCTEKIACPGSRIEGQTFKCPDQVCPEVKCPVPAETICECAPAQPIKKEICPEVRRCHVCHKERAHHVNGCKSGNCCKHGCAGYEAAPMMTETKTAPASAARHHMKTPKRIGNAN